MEHIQPSLLSSHCRCDINSRWKRAAPAPSTSEKLTHSSGFIFSVCLVLMTGKELFFLSLLEINQRFFHRLSGQPKGFKELHQGTEVKEKRIFLLYLFPYFLWRKQEFFFPCSISRGKRFCADFWDQFFPSAGTQKGIMYVKCSILPAWQHRSIFIAAELFVRVTDPNLMCGATNVELYENWSIF